MSKESTTLFIEPKRDARDRISVEVGDSKQAEFLPQTKVMRWANEVNLSVRLVHEETRATVEESSGLVKWRGQKQEAHFYELPVSDLHPEGASEVEVLLLERPETNVVRFSLNTKGLTLYRQELTDDLRKLGVEIPEHILGSYAVYVDTPKTNFADGNLYRSGKVGHIYRPFVIDANGNGVWGDLRVDTDRGLLTVTIPQEFIDSAAYPIRHAAGLTFGYTTVGAVGYTQNSNAIMVQVGTVTSPGLIDSYSFYTESPRFGYQNAPCRMAVYNAAGTAKLEDIAEFTTGTFGPGWYTVNSAAHAAVTAADHNVALWADNGIDDVGVWVAFDSGSLATYDSETYGTLTAWPTTLSLMGLGVTLSMYVTYLPLGGALKSRSVQMQPILAR